MRWMHQYVANRNVFRDCLKLFSPIIDSASCPAGNSRPTDQPHKKPVGHRSWAGDAVRPGAVGWQIEDVAVMRHLRLVGTILRGTMQHTTVHCSTVQHIVAQWSAAQFMCDDGECCSECWKTSWQISCRRCAVTSQLTSASVICRCLHSTSSSWSLSTVCLSTPTCASGTLFLYEGSKVSPFT